jgi:site-specific recombinase XerD
MNTEPHGDLILESWDEYSLESKAAESSTSNDLAVIEYLEWMRDTRFRTPRTLHSYGATLNDWLEWLGPQSMWLASLQQMEAFMARPRIRRAHGAVGAPATQRRDAAVLRSFYQWAWERDHVQVNRAKALHSPPVHNIDPKPIADEHWLELWNNPRRSASDLVALGLGYYCGLRRAEILSLTVGNITPTVIKEFRRKGNLTHTLPWAELIKVYDRKLPHLNPDPLRFGTAMRSLVEDRPANEQLILWPTKTGASMNKRMVAWCNQSGIAHYSPHQLRHGCATNLVRAGVELPLVARMLNHSSTSTTMRYVQAGGRELAEWLSHQ